MFGVRGVMATLGAKKIVFVGDNKELVNNMRENYLDVLCVDDLDALLIISPLLNYEVVIEETTLVKSMGIFDEVFSLFRGSVLVILNKAGGTLSKTLKIENQGTLDRLFLNAGYMLHESNMTTEMYNFREKVLFNFRSLYRKISPENLKKYPEDYLLENRSLHMDMLREPGARSDCHVIRYFLASTLVKKGDSVLDCACGLGYGSSILSANSLGSSYLGIDIESSSIEYANDMYGIDDRLSFQVADAEDLNCIENETIDFVCSYETIEHVPNYQRLVQEYFRILSPGGRMIISAPNMWVDETGKDPNPYHFHEFDYKKLVDCLESEGFLLEKSYLHTAPGGPTNFFAKRVLKEVEIGPESITPELSDWITLVVIKSPFSKTDRLYSYSAYEGAPENYTCTDFNRFYANPWIYRSLIQIGERVDNSILHGKLIEDGLSNYFECRHQYADYGACLTVKGYLLLENGTNEQYKEYLETVQSYIFNSKGDDNVHIYRWKISSAFVATKVAMKLNVGTIVLELFNYIIESNPEKFSPLLMTKKLNVLFYIGIFALQNSKIREAKEYFIEAINAGRKALIADGINSFGCIEKPNSFGFSELAEVSDMTQQCVTALNEIDMYSVNAGFYWSKIDLKRFGLLSYARSLERENLWLKSLLA